MANNPVFSAEKLRLYDVVLDFLEQTYCRWGIYTPGSTAEETVRDILILCFTKIVADCRAILLLLESGYYIQAGILSRSTEDACLMVMQVGFEGDEALAIRRWLHGRRVTHWNLVERINQCIEEEPRLDVDAHRTMRRRLDDLVHSNYEGLKLYPAQSPGPTPLDKDSFRKLVFWTPLVHLFLVTCLLAVPLLAADSEQAAETYRLQLEKLQGEG